MKSLRKLVVYSRTLANESTFSCLSDGLISLQSSSGRQTRSSSPNIWANRCRGHGLDALTHARLHGRSILVVRDRVALGGEWTGEPLTKIWFNVVTWDTPVSRWTRRVTTGYVVAVIESSFVARGCSSEQTISDSSIYKIPPDDLLVTPGAACLHWQHDSKPFRLETILESRRGKMLA